MSDPSVVKLKNGAVETRLHVSATMMSLRHLFASYPMAAYELVLKARESQHRFFGNSAFMLKKFGLVDFDDSLHESTRNVVLSAVSGNSLEAMTLGDPKAPTG